MTYFIRKHKLKTNIVKRDGFERQYSQTLTLRWQKLKRFFLDMFLPVGYPHSVAKEYFETAGVLKTQTSAQTLCENFLHS